MKTKIYPLLIFILLCFSILPIIQGYNSEPNVEIVKVDYPSQVIAGQSFIINVSLSYSYEGWLIADLGAFNQNYTDIFDYIRYYLTGNAVRSFSLSVKAPITSTDLQLTIASRYWYRNFWGTNEKCIKEVYIKVMNLSKTETVNEWPTTITIGKSEWYYWNNSISHTCLIWLSGGHSHPDHVTINPYEMETFGVMKYIKDLSKHYSVLALRKGTEKQVIPFSSQTFYVLSYYPYSVFLRDLYDWSSNKGYNFTFLIGYSTGGVAVGYEIAVRDSENWAAPDGAIIISAPLEGVSGGGLLESSSHARDVGASIQLLYGEVWSEGLWPQGKEFYDNAPDKTGNPSYFKEWHLFPDSSHEVWVKEEDGAHYDKTAYILTVQFIEKCRSLWIGSEEETLVNFSAKTVDQEAFCEILFTEENFLFQYQFYMGIGEVDYKKGFISAFKEKGWDIKESSLSLFLDEFNEEIKLTFTIENFSEKRDEVYIIKLTPIHNWQWNQSFKVFSFFSPEGWNGFFGPWGPCALKIELPQNALNATLNTQFEIEYKKPLNVYVKIELDKNQHDIGEEISFIVKIKNEGQWRFTHKQSSIDYEIVNDRNVVVYRWSRHIPQGWGESYETIDPGQTLVYELSWNQKNDEGEQTPAGDYTLLVYVEDVSVEEEIHLTSSQIPSFQILSIALGLVIGVSLLLYYRRHYNTIK